MRFWGSGISCTDVPRFSLLGYLFLWSTIIWDTPTATFGPFAQMDFGGWELVSFLDSYCRAEVHGYSAPYF
jgi:hypothetical protein